jgi:hypothetical protein
MAKPSYPKTNQEKAKLYLHCMVEVKERLHMVAELLGAPFAPLFVQELCHLQLRHICELIAIACLAAQGDYETQRSFTESYKPPEIFRSLRKLYPDFFPEPVERVVRHLDDGRRHHHIERFHIHDAYSENDVSTLWSTSGDHLHRASVNKYLRTTFVNRPPDLDPIYRHLEGIAKLLNHHTIPIQRNPHEDVRILIEMGQRQEAVRLMFLHINQDENTVQIEEYNAELQR